MPVLERAASPHGRGDWPELYDRVTDCVARVRPDLAPRFEKPYPGLRPAGAEGGLSRARFDGAPPVPPRPPRAATAVA